MHNGTESLLYNPVPETTGTSYSLPNLSSLLTIERRQQLIVPLQGQLPGTRNTIALKAKRTLLVQGNAMEHQLRTDFIQIGRDTDTYR